MPKAAVPCVGFHSKLKAHISCQNMHKQVKKNRLNEKMPRPFFIFCFQMDFFFPIFENLSSAGSKNRKLNCFGLRIYFQVKECIVYDYR